MGQNGAALQVAPKSLQDDKEVALAAVAQNGYALQFASTKLKADIEVVLAAAADQRSALMFASAEVQMNFDALTQNLLAAHKALVSFLLAARPSEEAGLISAARPTIWKLEGLGKDAGQHVKQLIADFSGAPRGQAWVNAYICAHATVQRRCMMRCDKVTE